jgi:hypothetical protein
MTYSYNIDITSIFSKQIPPLQQEIVILYCTPPTKIVRQIYTHTERVVVVVAAVAVVVVVVYVVAVVAVVAVAAVVVVMVAVVAVVVVGVAVFDQLLHQVSWWLG